MIPLLPTGAVTRWPDFPDHRRLLELLPPLECELSIYRTWDERVIGDLAGLRVVTAHAEKSIGATLSGDEPAFELLALSCRIAAGLGARLLVLHLWELPDGDRFLERNLERLPACLDLAEEHGLTLAVETIPCSVGTPVENVMRACERDERCRVTLDTEFLAFHDQLDAALGLRERVAHMHVKDFDGSLRDLDGRRRYLLPGEGTIDVEGFLDALGWDGTVTLEMSAVRDDGSIDEPRLQDALAWIRKIGT